MAPGGQPVMSFCSQPARAFGLRLVLSSKQHLSVAKVLAGFGAASVVPVRIMIPICMPWLLLVLGCDRPVDRTAPAEMILLGVGSWERSQGGYLTCRGCGS